MGISPFVQWSAAPLPSLGSLLSLHQAPPFLSELHLIRTCHPGYSYHHPAYPSSNTQKHTHRALVHYGLHALTCSYICIAWAHYIMTLPWVQPSHPSYGRCKQDKVGVCRDRQSMLWFWLMGHYSSHEGCPKLPWKLLANRTLVKTVLTPLGWWYQTDQAC